MIPILLLLLLLVVLYLFFLAGRKNHPELTELRRWKYAHRGLHDTARPENSMAAFRAALEKGYGIELDIHLMKDGNLAVIHDSSLQRVAGSDVRIEDLTLADLEHYRLGNSQEKIPLFREVLTLYAGRAPLVVELKCTDGNHAALCHTVMELLDSYDGLYCVESFDPRAVYWFRKHRPEICRGQLSENSMGSKVKVPWIIRFCLTYHLGNLLTRPDFIAYKYADRKTFGTDICRKVLGLQGVSWTLKTPQEYDTAVSEGWIPIFENFEP